MQPSIDIPLTYIRQFVIKSDQIIIKNFNETQTNDTSCQNNNIISHRYFNTF